MNATTKRVKIFRIFPILALIVSSFSILITPMDAGAANYKDLSVEDKARAYTYYRAAASCMSGLKNEIKADAQYDGLRTDPANGYWYGTGDKNNPDRKGDWWSGDAKNEADVTPKTTSSFGTLGCTEITKTALQDYWGGTSPADLLKALKYEWNGTDKWVFKGDGSKKSDYLKSFLSSKGVDMQYTPAVEYFVNYNAFVNKNYCNAKNNGLFSAQSDSIKNRYNSYNTALTAYEGKTVYIKTTISSGTTTTQNAFTYTGNTELPQPLQGSYLLYFDNYKTCDQMASNISEHAAAYTDALLVKSCTDAGVSGRYINACKDGLRNTGNAAYCDKYSDEAEKNACVLGVGTQVPSPPASEAPADNTEAGEAGTSCAIDGIGWIICPIFTFLANIADASFNFLTENFLRTDVKILDTEGPTYDAWTVMRNLANIAFVIIFIFIIFSQVTSMGVSNYGVKKMLPRLVIAAILVNISFIICQLAVDLSNIIGYSIDGAISGVSNSIPMSGGDVSGFATGIIFSDVVVGVIAITASVALLYSMLSIFGPILLAAVVALVMILFLLVARQALIVILIVLAPLAFVAFLLPNTERLFTQWRKMFTALLLLFPIIALVFGLSKLASTILTASFSVDVGGDSAANSMWGQIVGAAVLVLPLFVVPMLLKKSLDGIPMLGQLANKWSSKANGNLSRKLKEGYAGSTVGRGRAIRKHARDVYRGRKFAEKISGDGKMSAINRGLASGINVGAGKYANDALMKNATSAMVKAREEELGDARKYIEELNLSGKQRQDLAMGRTVTDSNGKPIKNLGGSTMQKAAISMQMGGAGSWGEVQEIAAASSGGLSQYSATIGALAGGSSGKDPALSGKRIDQISQGKFNYDDAVAEAIGEGKYTAEALAGMNDGARERAITIARAKEAAGDPSYMAALRKSAAGIKASSEISGKIAGNAEAEKQINALLSGQGAVAQQAQQALQTPQPARTGGTATSTGDLFIARGAQDVRAAAQAPGQTTPGQQPPTNPNPPTTP